MKYTNESIVSRFKEIHGDKYDYSKVEHKNMHTKVCIVCPIHGDFYQRPHDHLRGVGCPYCAGKNITTEEFIKRANKVHKGKYSYPNANYINSYTPIKIECPTHGCFEQTPNCHVIQKQGCPKCNKYNKLNTETFIEKARIKHGDEYLYLGEYENSQTPIKIKCKKHDYIFEQKPAEHIRGHGCPICGKEKNHNSQRLTQEEFISRCREKHNNKYDYSKAEYINGRHKVCIICPTHGEFWQAADMHMSGQGCPKCSKNYKLTQEDFIKRVIDKFGDGYDLSQVKYVNITTPVKMICPKGHSFERNPQDFLSSDYGCPICGVIERNNALRLTTEEFICRAKAIHGNKYIYKDVRYIDTRTKVSIICPKHGTFQQNPHFHLSGGGCPHCVGSKGEGRIRRWLSENGILFVSQYKIDLPQQFFSRNKIRVDFFLPKHNTIIEFHGIQHYKCLEFFHQTEEEFIKQQDRDKRLRKYCKDRKITLIEISYRREKQIELILNKKLGGILPA